MVPAAGIAATADEAIADDGDFELYAGDAQQSFANSAIYRIISQVGTSAPVSTGVMPLTASSSVLSPAEIAGATRIAYTGDRIQVAPGYLLPAGDDGDPTGSLMVAKNAGRTRLEIQEGFTVSYYKYDAASKTRGERVGAVVDPGSYVSVVTVDDDANADVNGVSLVQYRGYEFELPFTVVSGNLTIAELHEGDGTDNIATTNTNDQLMYTGSEFDVNAKVQNASGVTLAEGVDYTLKFFAGNATDFSGDGVEVKDAGSYKAVVQGIGAYAGSEPSVVQFTVRPFLIDGSTVVKMPDVVAPSISLPTKPESVKTGTNELDPSLVTVVYNDGYQLNDANSAYNQGTTGAKLVKAVSGDDNINIANSDGSGITVNRVGALATFQYGSSALPSEVTVDKSDPKQSFNTAQIAVKCGTETLASATDYTVTVDKKSGSGWASATPSASLNTSTAAAGIYRVTVTVNPATLASPLSPFDCGGTATTIVTVTNGELNADANVYVNYGGEIITSLSTVYTGAMIQDTDFTIVAKKNDDTPVAAGEITAKLLGADGKEVASIKDAGSYTLQLSSDAYNLKGTTSIPITISPLDLTTLDIAEAYSGAVAKSSGVKYIVTDTTNQAIADWVAVQYDTGKKNAKGESVYETLPSSVAAVNWAKYNDKTGKYDADLPNFNVISNVELTASVPLGEKASNYKVGEGGKSTYQYRVTPESHCIFNDVTPAADTWYFESVCEAAAAYDAYFNPTMNPQHETKYVNGLYNTKQYLPDQAINRGQVACILFNMAGSPDVQGDYPGAIAGDNTPHFNSGFSDVPTDSYYAMAITWAKQAGVVSGYSGTDKFGPEDPVTREQFACMLANYAQKVNNDFKAADPAEVLADMPDKGQVSAWAEQNVAWAVASKVMGNGGFINPLGNVTRAEAASMAVNYQPRFND